MIILNRPPNNEQRKEWAEWFYKVYALLSENGNDYKIGLLGTKSGVDMRTAGSTTIFTTHQTKITRITHVVVRDPSASMAGGTSYAFTNWRSGLSLASLTTAGTDYMVFDGNNTKYTEISANTNFDLTVTTGTSVDCTATIDVFGYTTD